MKLPVAAALIVSLVAIPAVAESKATLATNRPRYAVGRNVSITLTNDSKSKVVLEEPWRVTKGRDQTIVATQDWGAGKTVRPGSSLTWRWDQTGDDGAEVGPGKYTATVPTGTETLETTFLIGRYFTLGFHGSDETFVVFVRNAKPAQQMKDEAESEEKSLIVSGIVRGAAPYNPQWSYSMGPGSIVLGEVFVEVCDASPQYVEQHRKRWMGQRWCPWSSYVDHEGK